MRVIVKTESYTISDWHDGEQYDSWESSYSWSITGVKTVDDDYKTEYGEEGFLIPDDSTHAYVLYMRYGTGDSFGHSSGSGEVIGVFGKKETAEAAYKAVEENKESYEIVIKDDFEREIKLWNPGAGYFACVEELGIETHAVGDSDTLNIKKRF